MINNELDAILPVIYLEVNTPADQLLTDTLLGDRFVEAVQQRFSGTIEKTDVLRRLLTLRSSGRRVAGSSLL